MLDPQFLAIAQQMQAFINDRMRGEWAKLLGVAYYSWDYGAGRFPVSGINDMTLQKSDYGQLTFVIKYVVFKYE